MNIKRYAPATQRNRQPILEILLEVLPKSGNVLEVASGTGEHAVFFSKNLPNINWYPSDCDRELLESITAWNEENSLENLHSPRLINVSDAVWEIEQEKITISAIVNINMIHISPWSACLGLMAGANRILSDGGILYLYGPYKRSGKHTANSNEAFDRSLKSRDREWGVRNLEDVVEVAKKQGLELQKIVPMPANNFSLIFKRNKR